MALQDEYLDYCNKFNSVWKYIQSCSKSIDDITEEVCSHRLYFDSFEKWRKIFGEIGISYVTSETCDYTKFQGDAFKDLALFSEDGYFLMNERYILPVKDMLGNVIALIGWYPDNKRYITTPSRFFSKDCLFFGLEQLKDTGIGKDYFIVEGIFDSLSLRALGFNAVAMMGISTSKIKVPLYGLFRKLVAIPDNDKQGRKVLDKDLWRLPMNGSYLKWIGGLNVDEEDKVVIKDIDVLCRVYEDDSIIRVLSDCFKKTKRIIKLVL